MTTGTEAINYQDEFKNAERRALLLLEAKQRIKRGGLLTDADIDATIDDVLDPIVGKHITDENKEEIFASVERITATIRSAFDPKIIEALPVCACCHACKRLVSFKPECSKAILQ